MQISSKEKSKKIYVEDFFIEYGHQAISGNEYIHGFEISNQKKKNLSLRHIRYQKGAMKISLQLLAHFTMKIF